MVDPGGRVERYVARVRMHKEGGNANGKHEHDED
jgi:hypothetical protein